MSYGRLIQQANVQEQERSIISEIAVSGKELARWLQYIEDKLDVETFYIEKPIDYYKGEFVSAKSMSLRIDTRNDDDQVDHATFIGIIPVTEDELDKDIHYVDQCKRDAHLSLIQKALDELEEYLFNEGVSKLGLYYVMITLPFVNADKKTQFDVVIRSYQEF